MHVIFDPSSVSVEDFDQDGAGFYYYGFPYQRGYGYHGAGIGSVFRSLIRFLIPLAKKAGKTVGKEALVTSARILDNIAQGAELRETILNETKKGVKRMASRVDKTKQEGGAVPRKKRKASKKSKKKQKITRKMILGRRVLDGVAFEKPKTKLGFF